ncbi:hypothetical protein ACOI8V_09255, partial [Bifidobacterium hominis]|uniref:hypothetical protein n=1 Tax=Bifidobacterium hominis TaxID=3133177 RepID=UPI003D0279F3
ELTIAPWTATIQSAQLFGHYLTPLTDDREYSYLEVPWISDIHGCIQRIDRKKDLTSMLPG